MKTLFAALLSLSLWGLTVPSYAADEAACKTMWETADANKDGALEATERQDSMEGIKDPDVQRFDLDQDSKLSAAEFTEGCKADVFKVK